MPPAQYQLCSQHSVPHKPPSWSEGHELRKLRAIPVVPREVEGNGGGHWEYLNAILLGCALHLTELAKEMRSDN